jgi:crotonobetainyl-CoA:carnitine CoA-transferase CaiB-like acyl-CoA transferase
VTIVETQTQTRAGPLDGLKILDFTIMMAGPLCTRLLADVGAEVIKVEAPEGDHIRTRPPLRDGHSTYFGQLNCGKESIALDLKRPEALAIAHRLAAAADVVVENFRPGVMKRLGLDYASLAADNPGLVYCSISGFGQSGPAAAKPAYAPVIHAASGFDLANLYYQDGQERPAKTGIFVADVLGGVYAFGAIQSALIERHRTGRGQAVDVSLMDCMLNLMVYECQEAQFPSERRRPLYKPLFAKDGYVIVAPVSQNNFERLTEAVGHPEWKTDTRFATIGAREQNWDLLMSLVEQWTRERPALDCETILMAAGIPTSRYLTVAEAMADPHLAARGSLARVDDGGGTFTVPNAPFQFSGGNVGARPFVAPLGGHGPEILRRLLGLGDTEIDALERSGALHG